jgi:hypothetical protein
MALPVVNLTNHICYFVIGGRQSKIDAALRIRKMKYILDFLAQIS